jgi:hypothetical protein
MLCLMDHRETEQTVSAGGATDYFKSPCLEPEQKILWLKITIAMALMCGFGLSWRLWISTRLFPLSPVSNSLPVVRFPLDYIWFVSLLLLLLAIAIANRPRWFILAFLVLAALLSLWDQARWQPWFYQYLSMLASIGLYMCQQRGTEGYRIALSACRLIVVLTYLWSGLQKLNVTFIRETWPDIASAWLRLLPALNKLPPWTVLIIPLLEILIAMGLLTRKFRQAAVIFAIITHAVVLMLLVYSGENTVVWSWNLAMIVFAVVLFWQDNETSPREILAVKHGFHALVLLLFGFMPILSFFDLWDSYLSSALYSGNTHQAVIIVSPAMLARLPGATHAYIWQNSQPLFLDVNRWAYGELNVPLYPEPRIYRRVAEQMCEYTQHSPDIKLLIRDKPDPLTGFRKSAYYDCDHLDAVP